MHNELQLLMLLGVCLRVSFQHFVRAPTLRFLQASSLRRVILDSLLSSNVTLWSFQYSYTIITVASKLSGLARSLLWWQWKPKMVLRHPWWNYSKKMLRKAWQKRSILVLALRSLFSQIPSKSRWDSSGFYQPAIHFFYLLLLFFYLGHHGATKNCCAAIRSNMMISWERGRAGNGALLPFKGWSLNQEALPPRQNNRWGVRFLCYVPLRKIAKKAALSAKKPYLTTNR